MDRNDNGLIIFDKLVMAAIDALLLPAFVTQHKRHKKIISSLFTPQ